MEHGANSVDMTEHAFSEAIGDDITQPQEEMVLDLTSVYRIDVTSRYNTVAMNAKICLTEEVKEKNLFRHIHVDTRMYTAHKRFVLI